MLTFSGPASQGSLRNIHEHNFKSSSMYSPTLEKYIFKGKRVKAISYRSQSPIIKVKPNLKCRDFQ